MKQIKDTKLKLNLNNKPPSHPRYSTFVLLGVDYFLHGYKICELTRSQHAACGWLTWRSRLAHRGRAGWRGWGWRFRPAGWPWPSVPRPRCGGPWPRCSRGRTACWTGHCPPPAPWSWMVLDTRLWTDGELVILFVFLRSAFQWRYTRRYYNTKTKLNWEVKISRKAKGRYAGSLVGNYLWPCTFTLCKQEAEQWEQRLDFHCWPAIIWHNSTNTNFLFVNSAVVQDKTLAPLQDMS